MKTVIIDCGGGNLQSVKNALDYLGFANVITSDLHQIQRADRVIFPGQGHFGVVMRQLEEAGLKHIIQECVSTKPFLGICVGMQVLLESSGEAPGVAGLGLLAGAVMKLPATQKIPQMGWNRVSFSQRPDLSGDYYFAHSYYCAVQERAIIAATTDYGITFPSACCKGSCWLVQFHPEKSGEKGLQFLENFMRQP